MGITDTKENEKHTAQPPGGPGATGSLDTRLKARESTVCDPSTSEGGKRLAGRALSHLPPPPPTCSPPSHALAHTHVEERTQTLECMMRPRVLDRLMGEEGFGEGRNCFCITNTFLQTNKQTGFARGLHSRPPKFGCEYTSRSEKYYIIYPCLLAAKGFAWCCFCEQACGDI